MCGREVSGNASGNVCKRFAHSGRSRGILLSRNRRGKRCVAYSTARTMVAHFSCYLDGIHTEVLRCAVSLVCCGV